MSATPFINADEATANVQPNQNQTINLISRLDAFLPLIKKANQELSNVDALRVDTHLQEEEEDDDDDDEEEEEGADGNGCAHDDATGTVHSHESRCSDPKALRFSHGEMTAPSNPTIQIEFAVGELNDSPIMKLLTTDIGSCQSGNTGHDNLDGDNHASETKRAVMNLLAVDETCKDKEPPRKKSLITEL